MTLQERIGALIVTIKGAHTTLAGRVTAVEGRLEAVEITQAAYDALTAPEKVGKIFVVKD